MSEYEPTIGLEVHAQLKTKTKMFCNSKNDPDETRPNVNICPVCLGHPGTLPVPNEQAVRWSILAGLALNGQIAKKSKFDPAVITAEFLAKKALELKLMFQMKSII